jgi:uncharacterized protein (DUF1697 family)
MTASHKGGAKMTATATTATEKQNIHKIIDSLSDDRIIKLAEQARLLIDEQEIAELEAKYGTTPNAETIAAMKELDDGGGEAVTMDELKAMLDEIG